MLPGNELEVRAARFEEVDEIQDLIDALRT